MDAMIQVEKLRKTFGSFVAVSDISFTVQRGEVLGFLGPNGAGKSTAMKMITGFLTPSAGSVKVCGYDVIEDPINVKKSIGYLPEGAPAYGDMMPRAFLEFIADIRGLKGEEKKARVDEAIAKTHLDSVLNKTIDTLSKGFKRRVGLAQAILHNPDVLILDEPTDGLDPNQKHEVRQLLKQMAKEKAIVISTHILEEVEAICTRAMIISQGKTLFDGTPAELEKLSLEKNAVQLIASGSDSDAIGKKLKAQAYIKDVTVADIDDKKSITVIPKDKKSIITEIAQLSRDEGWKIEALQVKPVQLDDVFRIVTTQGDSGEEVRT